MKYLNRWIYAAAGVVVMLFVGLVYAWTVLQAPIAASYPDWTKGQLSLTFTLTMFCFCIGGFLGGRMQKRWKPRILAWISAVFFLAGFSITSVATSLPHLYVGFGIFAGLGTGIIYNAVMSSVSAWFPDKQGLLSGVLLMGFGISSFIVGKIYTAVTPSDGSYEWRTTFIIIGILLCAVSVVSGFFLVKPDSEWQAPVSSQTKSVREVYEEVSTGEMLKRPSMWLFMVWATALSAAGLAIISQGTPMAMEACSDIGMDTVATIVGLLSVFNGIGRILFGALYDRLGRFWTMLLGGIVFVLALLMLLVAFSVHSMILLVLSYIAIGLGYGCVTPTNSAFVNRFYGRKDYPTNLSVINMNMLVASFGSTIAGAVFDATQSYTVIIVIVIALIVLGTVVSCLIKTPVVSKK